MWPDLSDHVHICSYCSLYMQTLKDFAAGSRACQDEVLLALLQDETCQGYPRARSLLCMQIIIFLDPGSALSLIIRTATRYATTFHENIV